MTEGATLDHLRMGRARSADWPEVLLQRQVTRAVRLGWYLAEVRGRCWWRGRRPETHGLPDSTDRPLPLRPERSPSESRQQAFDALVCLSERLDVSAPFSLGEPAPGDADFAPRLQGLLVVLEADDAALLDPPAADDAAGAQAREQAWAPVASLLYDWDKTIQDQLAARADVLACAYLLGRGLSECYWALAPDDDQLTPGGGPGAGSWSILFGPERRRELSRMAGRLGQYLNPLTPAAIAGSLEAWGCVAADPAWRTEPTASAALYEQLRRWYQLLVLGQDPSTLVKPSALLHGKLTTLRLFRAFWPQLLIGLASVAVVGLFVLLLVTGTGPAFVTTLLGIVGTVGLSVSTLAAKAKDAAQSLLARLRQQAYSDLVAIEVSSVPAHPGDGGQRKAQQLPATNRMLERAVAARTIAAPLNMVR